MRIKTNEVHGFAVMIFRTNPSADRTTFGKKSPKRQSQDVFVRRELNASGFGKTLVNELGRLLEVLLQKRFNKIGTGAQEVV